MLFQNLVLVKLLLLQGITEGFSKAFFAYVLIKENSCLRCKIKQSNRKCVKPCNAFSLTI